METNLQYGEKNIKLSYLFAPDISPCNTILLKIEGSEKGNIEDYDKIEEIAQSWLLKKAFDKEECSNLVKIMGLKQNIICNQTNEGVNIEIILEGTGIYKRKL